VWELATAGGKSRSGEERAAADHVHEAMDVIVDLDGTLADCTHRLHHIKDGQRKNWDAFFAGCHLDEPNPVVVSLVHSLERDHRIIFCSGRPEKTRKDTEKWLREHLGVVAPQLYMRGDSDRRADDIVKRELLERIRSDGFDPKLAIDDRQRVVDMWRSEGLVCAQVAEGDF
jgi:phosphoglycolate phosphatase-like HAD superfamily hydrolase